jgi:hypothetical protein
LPDSKQAILDQLPFWARPPPNTNHLSILADSTTTISFFC